MHWKNIRNNAKRGEATGHEHESQSQIFGQAQPIDCYRPKEDGRDLNKTKLKDGGNKAQA